jgi:phospholipid transport system substrate-binding protein
MAGSRIGRRGVAPLLLLWLGAGMAAAQPSGPAAPIAMLNDALLKIMHMGAATPFAARAAAMTPVVQQVFDLPGILRVSVGFRWSSIPPAQQAELLDLLTRYTVDSYVANFDSFNGQRFEIAPQTRKVGRDVVVQTRILPVSGDPSRIDFQMRETGATWKAVDVLLDGTISRVAVQRSDFGALLGSGGAAALIASLRSKCASLESGGG